MHMSRSTLKWTWGFVPKRKTRTILLRPPEDPVKIQRQAAREEEARLANAENPCFEIVAVK